MDLKTIFGLKIKVKMMVKSGLDFFLFFFLKILRFILPYFVNGEFFVLRYLIITMKNIEYYKIF